MTVVDSIAGILFYGMAAPWTVDRLIAFMLSQAKFGGPEGKRLSSMAKIQKRLLKVERVIAFLSFLIIEPLTLLPDMGTQKLMLQLYMAGNGICTYFLVFGVAKPACCLMERLIQETVNTAKSQAQEVDPQILNLLGKIRVCIRELRNNGSTQLLGCIVFLCWSYLYNKASYQMVLGEL